MQTIGRSDRVELPGLSIADIHAKIDTGAYTCSLHCSRAEVVNGVLEFVLLDAEHPEYTGTIYKFTVFEQREIKNSFGEAEKRYVIKTPVKIFNKVIKAEFSLSNRGNLKFPVLLGRKIIRNRFMVDVMQKDVSYQFKLNGKTLPPSSKHPLQ